MSSSSALEAKRVLASQQAASSQSQQQQQSPPPERDEADVKADYSVYLCMCCTCEACYMICGGSPYAPNSQKLGRSICFIVFLVLCFVMIIVAAASVMPDESTRVFGILLLSASIIGFFVTMYLIFIDKELHEYAKQRGKACVACCGACRRQLCPDDEGDGGSDSGSDSELTPEELVEKNKARAAKRAKEELLRKRQLRAQGLTDAQCELREEMLEKRWKRQEEAEAEQRAARGGGGGGGAIIVRPGAGGGKRKFNFESSREDDFVVENDDDEDDALAVEIAAFAASSDAAALDAGDDDGDGLGVVLAATSAGRGALSAPQRHPRNRAPTTTDAPSLDGPSALAAEARVASPLQQQRMRLAAQPARLSTGALRVNQGLSERPDLYEQALEARQRTIERNTGQRQDSSHAAATQRNSSEGSRGGDFMDNL